MPQGPLQVDSVRLQNDDTIVTRDGSGNLTLQDSIVTTPATLSELFGIKNITEAFFVGTGSGATHSTIQDAINAVPVSTNGYAIFILPGSYSETLTFNKNNAYLIGLGNVTISSAAAQTILIDENVSEPAEFLFIKGLRVINTAAGGNCISIEGTATTTLGNTGIYIRDCILEASGSASRQINASIVNKVHVDRCEFLNSDGGSLMLFSQVADLSVSNIKNANIIQVSYNSGGSLPDTAGFDCLFDQVHGGNFLASITGAGSGKFVGGELGNCTLSGDQSFVFRNTEIGNISINDTISVDLINTKRGTIAGAGNSRESRILGSVSFAAATTASYSFDTTQTDVNYFVFIENSLNETPRVENKTTAGFDIVFSVAQTTTLSFFIQRDL